MPQVGKAGWKSPSSSAPIPAVSYCATQKVPPEIDELALAGGLMGAPVKLVKCQTVDLEVPASSEIVLEGIIPTNYMEEEGPYGESMGYVDPRTLSTMFELKCATHRKNPIWVSIISQVTPSESSKIKAMGMATLVKRFVVSKGFDCVKEVHMIEPLVNMRPYVAVRFKKRNDDDPWGVMQAVLDYARPGWQDDRRRRRRHQHQRPNRRDLGDHAPLASRIETSRSSAIGRSARRRSAWWRRIHRVVTTIRNPHCSSTLRAKPTFRRLSLPKEEFMVRAKEIWEELGLPKLEPQEPWHGYLMGLWPENLDQEAEAGGAQRA